MIIKAGETSPLMRQIIVRTVQDLKFQTHTLVYAQQIIDRLKEDGSRHVTFREVDLLHKMLDALVLRVEKMRRDLASGDLRRAE